MSAQISKKSDAPEGTIKVTVGPDSFKITDDTPYETDNWAIIETIQNSYSDMFDVKVDDDPVSDAKAEAKALNKLAKEQEKVKEAIATKDPLDPAPEVPQTIDDLTDSKETK